MEENINIRKRRFEIKISSLDLVDITSVKIKNNDNIIIISIASLNTIKYSLFENKIAKNKMATRIKTKK